MADFGAALTHMRIGGLATRKGWNGKGMYIYLVDGSKFVVDRAPLNKIVGDGVEVNYLPHIDMRTAQGDFVPWLASQADLLANDWLPVDAENFQAE